MVKKKDKFKQQEKKVQDHQNLVMMSSTSLRHDPAAEPLQPSPELRTFPIKLGWIQGVLIPCLLNIWGVMLFLRISWIVAQAGIGFSMLIIFMSTFVCVLTTLSLSAICTNGVVQGGGVYYLVSRSLGAELGASVGIIFAFANAVAASMNTIGFCESLNELLASYNAKILDNSVNDIRIVGTIAILVMCVICAIGMDWETKTQNFLITVIVLAIGNYIGGACVGPLKEDQMAKGFFGIRLDIAQKNWLPDYRQKDDKMYDFFSVFAMYFPAVTGVQAGANICGDLRDPATAIPKGTLLAVLISSTSYLTMAMLCGVTSLRDASGKIEDLHYDNLDSCKPDCRHGLHNNYQMMQLAAFWDLLIFFGCWAATLSTALTNLLAVPRLIQALGKDEIYPGLIFFSKPYGRHGEPYRGYVLTFFVSVTFLLIADLDKIAPLITNFYLASYSLINFCTFHADFVNHLSWRPRFRFYHKWLSLLGFVMCLCIMMIISWMMALATVLLFLTLYLVVHYRRPSAAWGSSTEAQQYSKSVSYLLSLAVSQAPIKSYNPRILVLSGRPYLNAGLLSLAQLIVKHGSFMIAAEIETIKISAQERRLREEIAQNWLITHKYYAFYVLLDNHEMDDGVSALLQCTGLGRLSPNILLVSFFEGWASKPQAEIAIYVRTLQQAFDNNAALTILRLVDTERSLKTKEMQTNVDAERDEAGLYYAQEILHSTSEEFLAYGRNSVELDIISVAEKPALPQTSKYNTMRFQYTGRETELIATPIEFNENSIIDAWWIFDDGGLNILLPYLISSRSLKTKVPLRIFVLDKKNDKDDEPAYEQIKALLKEYRIEYESLVRIQGLDEEPTNASWKLFNDIITPFMTDNFSETGVTPNELKKLQPKTSRYLRLRELLIEYSYETTLVVLSLPLPRKGLVSTPLYMAWLEVLSYNMPPILFVRGNTAAVLDI